MFLCFIRKVKAVRVRWNSIYWTLFLRFLGARVGKGIVFGGQVFWKFNGDPRRIVIEDGVTFQGDVDLRNRENGSIVIESGCSFDNAVRLVAARESTIRLGRRTQVGMDLVINAGADVTLGEDCLVSSHVHINGSGHPTYRDLPIVQQGYIQKPVRVGNDVWLANCVNILMGTTIEDGVIIGANSVVSGHYPAYSVVLGNPARVVGQRGSRHAASAPDFTPPVPEPVRGRMAKKSQSETVRALQELLVRLRILKKPPSPTARLRRDGYLDSLNWALFFEGITDTFGDVLSLEDFLSPDLDTLEGISLWLRQREKPGFSKNPAPYGLYDRIADLARQKPNHPILHLKYEGGPEILLTYQHLVESGARCAGFLRAQGFQSGDRLGLLMPLSEDLVVIFIGCLQIGVIPSVFAYPSEKVPLPTYVRNHQDIFSRVGLKALCSTEELASLLKNVVNQNLAILDHKCWRTFSPLSDVQPAVLEGTVLIQHSSGTTGFQKGVAFSSKAVSLQIDLYAQALDLSDRDVIVSWLPLYHDMGLVACFLLPLLTGTRFVLFSPFEWVVQPILLFDLLARHRGTLVWLPNFAFQLLADRTSASAIVSLDLSSVRAFISCSEVVTARAMRAFQNVFGGIGVTEKHLWSCYAMAENVFAITQSPQYKVIRVDEEILQKEDRVVLTNGGREIVSQGHPLPGTNIRVLDKNGEFLPKGHQGEICLKGPCLMSGYFRNPEKTNEAFFDGWFKTGDLGFLWDGELYVTGRIKDLVIIAGRNYYSQDIETVVSQVPGIKPGRCVAFGCPNPRRGTEELVLVAEKEFPGLETEVIASTVKKVVFEKLDCLVSDFVMVNPGWVIKTSSGKINRGECRQKYLNMVGGASH